MLIKSCILLVAVAAAVAIYQYASSMLAVHSPSLEVRQQDRTTFSEKETVFPSSRVPPKQAGISCQGGRDGGSVGLSHSVKLRRVSSGWSNRLQSQKTPPGRELHNALNVENRLKSPTSGAVGVYIQVRVRTCASACVQIACRAMNRITFRVSQNQRWKNRWTWSRNQRETRVSAAAEGLHTELMTS